MESIELIFEVVMLTAFSAAVLRGMWVTHERNCEETPQLDAKPSAADELLTQK